GFRFHFPPIPRPFVFRLLLRLVMHRRMRRLERFGAVVVLRGRYHSVGPRLSASPALAAGLPRPPRAGLPDRALGVRCLATFAAGYACLFRREMVGRPLGMSRFATLAGNLPLLLPVHCGKTAFALLGHDDRPLRQMY